jgi:WD40 repeat protein
MDIPRNAGTVRVQFRAWDLVTGEGLPAYIGQEGPKFRWDWSSGPVFSPDNRTMAGIVRVNSQKQIRLWEVETGGIRRVIELEPGHAAGVTFSPDGRHLAAAVNNVVCIWDLLTGREVRRFHGHSGAVAGLAFSPDGRRLLTWSRDSTALIWEVADLAKAPE